MSEFIQRINHITTAINGIRVPTVVTSCEAGSLDNALTILLLDISGSMNQPFGNSKINYMLQGLQNADYGNDYVTLFVFNTECNCLILPQNVKDFCHNLKLLNIKANGSTYLMKAVKTTLEYIENISNVDNIINTYNLVVMTDGQEQDNTIINPSKMIPQMINSYITKFNNKKIQFRMNLLQPSIEEDIIDFSPYVHMSNTIYRIVLSDNINYKNEVQNISRTIFKPNRKFTQIIVNNLTNNSVCCKVLHNDGIHTYILSNGTTNLELTNMVIGKFVAYFNSDNNPAKIQLNIKCQNDTIVHKINIDVPSNVNKEFTSLIQNGVKQTSDLLRIISLLPESNIDRIIMCSMCDHNSIEYKQFEHIENLRHSRFINTAGAAVYTSIANAQRCTPPSSPTQQFMNIVPTIYKSVANTQRCTSPPTRQVMDIHTDPAIYKSIANTQQCTPPPSPTQQFMDIDMPIK